MPLLSRPGSLRGPEGWAAVVPVLGQARAGSHGVGGGPRGTRRTESAARQGDRTAVPNVARMVVSLRYEGPLQHHTITGGPRKRCRGVSCESFASRPTHRGIHVSLQRTYADPRRLSRWRAPRAGSWSDETRGLGNISLWSRLGCNQVSASVLRNLLVQNPTKLTTFANGSWM